MTADYDRSHLASRSRNLGVQARAALHGKVGLLVLAVGLLGVLSDTGAIPIRHGVILHALFGALLWVCVVARFYRRLRRAPPMLPNDIRALIRDLSRWVYLLLYVLMFFRIAIGITRTAPHGAIFGPAEDFQSYLAAGLVALATIRMLPALCRHFTVQGERAPLPSGLASGLAKRPANIA